MLKITFAGCLGLSPVISTQFTLEMRVPNISYAGCLGLSRMISAQFTLKMCTVHVSPPEIAKN